MNSSLLLFKDHTPQFKSLSKTEQDDIENQCKSLRTLRESFTQDLVKNLKKIDENFQELRQAISIDIQNVGLHYFKDIIKALNDCLDRNDNNFNLKQKELADSEKQLANELERIGQNIFDVRIGRTNWLKTPRKYKPLDTHHINLPESISLFDDFLLKSGGHSGGWRPEDHQLFLLLKSKHKTEQVVELLHQKCPDITKDVVLEHDEWYEKYTKLLQDKKLAVQKWKQSKKSGQSLSVGNINEIMSRSDTPSSNPSTGRIGKYKRMNEEVKKQIAEWKLAKSLRTKEEQEKSKQEQEKKLELERGKKEMKMFEKHKIAEYINAKIIAQYEEKEELKNIKEEEKRNKSRKANIMIQVYRKQDEKRVQEKLERKKESVLKQLKTIERLKRVKSEVKVRRDPGRVYKQTSGWKNKVCSEQDEKGANVIFINHVPHLKVPEWRQDVKFQDQITL
uniref:Coiled-coil domain-containing protein 112 n=2 Tax=Cacopsylla melanoneura TaxID=428564 RepID=A0A8D8SST5_9HEMI